MFWRLTLREIAVVLDGVASRLRRERNENAWLAWHIEALARSKKLPKLADMMETSPKKQKRRQTVAEQISIAHRWTAALTRK
ncbi:hypothetical protein CQ059_04855 [Brucella pseudogrignonensis]|nr:hypothetical protein [Ochrobactrum sp. MYb237]PQZ43268.1 hypothetical protein CQ059_04855 [Brucella pseudogrignonensis]PRA43015.1 hypothetical protein CQ063_01340 [Brucella pseudogrignonensis]PRA72517.1 hypothetical protein CQ055_04240 [Brucella pseudogrignonensis]